MSVEDNLIKLIQTVVAKSSGGGFIVGEVTKVDKQQHTCDITTDGLELYDCRLSSVTSEGTDTRVVVFPEVGSMVAGIATNGLKDVLICNCSKVESMEIKCDSIRINDLRTQLDKMSARIDGIIDALENSAVGTQDGGLTYQSNITIALGNLQKEDFSSIEDAD